MRRLWGALRSGGGRTEDPVTVPQNHIHAVARGASTDDPVAAPAYDPFVRAVEKGDLEEMEIARKNGFPRNINATV